MSPAGPSALGTLLAQRLDAVLGITLSQQSNIASGARPDAVAQPGEAAGTALVRNETLRHPQENADHTAAQTEEQRAASTSATGLGAARPGAARAAVEGGITSSTPIALGRAAQAILALLDAYPEPAPVRGATPLLAGAGQSAAGLGPGAAAHSGAAGGGAAGSVASGAAAATSAGTGAAPQGTQGAASPQDTRGQAGAPRPAHASQQPGLAAAGAAQGAAGPSGPLAQHLALALRLALEHSGLFYESHLGELLAGRRSPAALRQEPQAMLGARPGPQTATGAGTQPQAAPIAGNAEHGDAPDQAGAAVAMPGRGAAAADAASLPQSGSPALPASHAAAAAGSAPAQALLHPDSHLLVRQQLETLATQAVEWRGAAWPGAAMDWRIERRDPQQESGPAPAHWASRLTLQLPRLGMVQARLTLAGNALALRLASPEAAALLESASPDLRARLLRCGLQISGLAIGAEPLPETGSAAGAQAGHAETGQ